MKIQKQIDSEDILLWSDGTWCHRYELEEMQHMSDDYEVLYFGEYKYEIFYLGLE